MEPQALGTWGSCSATEPHPNPLGHHQPITVTQQMGGSEVALPILLGQNWAREEVPVSYRPREESRAGGHWVHVRQQARQAGLL